jgi:hypothetical protein
MRVLLLERDTLAIPSATDDVFWVAFDSVSTTERGAFPDPQLASAAPLVRQSHTAVAPDRRHWAAVFVFADRFVVFEGRRFHCQGKLVRGVPPGPAPPPGQQPAISAADAVWTDSTLLVLARERGTPEDLAVLDEFGKRCDYLRSYRLPARVRSIAFDRNVLYLEYDDPAPGFVGVRW